MKIWIYYHIYQIPGWEQLVDEKITMMKEEGLWDAADKIVMQLHADPDNALRWMLSRKDVLKDKRVMVKRHIEMFGIIGVYPSFAPVHETYSIRELHDDCNLELDNVAVFRYHTKGATHLGKETWPVADKWNRYLEYWNIQQWKLCYSALQAGFDSTSCNWHNGCWSGNIWWATSKWIKTIPVLKWPHEVEMKSQLNGFSPRHDAEHWIGYTDPKKLELHHYEHAVDYRWCPEPGTYELDSKT